MHAAQSDATAVARRVVILNWRDPWHPEAGGSELYVHQVAHQLCQREFEVVWFSARYDGASKREVREGVTYLRRGGHLTVYLWAALLLLTRRLGRADAVLEVQNGMPFLATLFTRTRVVVLVHHVHREQWPVVGRVLARIGWFMESRVAVAANRHNDYLAVSEITREELAELGVAGDSVSIAHNGSPPIPAYTPQPQTSTPTLVTVSRLVPHKQVEHALWVVQRLRPEFPGLRLRVVGSGWWAQPLLELRQELGLTDSVDFLGHVDDVEKFEELSQAWVHVLPSLKEGWGLSIVEAASVGVPTVAYRSAGGVRESIVHGLTGVLAEDLDDFVEQVRRLLLDARLRADMGREARRRSDTFNWITTTDVVCRRLFPEEV